MFHCNISQEVTREGSTKRIYIPLSEDNNIDFLIMELQLASGNTKFYIIPFQVLKDRRYISNGDVKGKIMVSVAPSAG